jgi:hypothetical protein
MDQRIVPLAIAASFAGVHSQAGFLLAAMGRLLPG